MKLIINNELVEIAQLNPTVNELLAIRGVKPTGTAVAVNDRIIKKDLRDTIRVHEGDNITIISAAFGG